MKDYAVVQIAHRQYIVEPGKTYTVDKFIADLGKQELPVLAIAKNDDLTVGAPSVEKSKAVIEVIEQGKGEKVNTFIFRAKSRYRRRIGKRKRTTTFKVLEIK